MSTRSSVGNLFPPLDNPKLTVQRRSHYDPTLLNNSETAAEGNGDLPVPDLRTMEELCQPSLNGRGGPIAPIAIQAMNFGLKNDMIQQMAKMFFGKYFPPSMVTKRRNEITNFRQCLDELLFEAWERYKLSIDRYPNRNMLTVTQIDTFCNGLTLRHRDTINAAAGGTFMKRRPKKCYDLIENMTPQRLGHFSPTETLPGNTITNPKEDLKGITTRRGTAYPGPTIPTTSSSLVVERETGATKEMMHPTNNESIEDIQTQVVPTQSPVLTSEPVNSLSIEPVVSLVSAPKPNLKSLIPYPSRLQDQKLCEKANDQQLTDRSISRPFGDAKDVFIKVGTFHFPGDFVVVDFDADSRVPLILERSFLKIGRALIDVFEGELTLRVSKEAITFNLDQTSRYSANYSEMMANRIDVIDMACEEYSDFLLEEFDAFLALEDDLTSPKVDQTYVDSKGIFFF
nr:reverse transcriptase domain-containing protein [Tanacetum cinerariifolium]